MNVLALAKTKKKKIKTHFQELFHSFSNQFITKPKLTHMLKGPIHVCSLQKRTCIFHKKKKKKSSPFVRFFGSLLQVTRMDGALDHMRQFGFGINWLEKL